MLPVCGLVSCWVWSCVPKALVDRNECVFELRGCLYWWCVTCRAVIGGGMLRCDWLTVTSWCVVIGWVFIRVGVCMFFACFVGFLCYLHFFGIIETFFVL